MYGSKTDARILADTISKDGARITTFEVVCPLHAHVHMLTHRAFSRNAQSNRAIPSKIIIKERAVYMPTFWGKNKKGMSPDGIEIGKLNRLLSIVIWRMTAEVCKMSVRMLSMLGLHKEVANRLVSPFLMVNSIITATDFDNFFVLRISDGAQSDIFELASKMRALLESSIPEISNIHVPLVDDIEIKKIREAVDIIDTARNGGADNNKIKLYALASRAFNLDLVKVAVGRCARVSYLTHIGNRDYTADIKLHDNLLRDRHMSPFEHVAVAANKDDRHANLTGWYSYRSNIDRMSAAARNRKIGKGE